MLITCPRMLAFLPICAKADVDSKRKLILSTAEDIAKAVAGKGYAYGGKSMLTGFDCSGLVWYVYAKVFPALHYMTTSEIERSDVFRETNNPRPGDLIFFPSGTNPYEVKRKNGMTFAGHVGSIISQDAWIGSQSSTGVARVSRTNVWWNARNKKYLTYAGL